MDKEGKVLETSDALMLLEVDDRYVQVLMTPAGVILNARPYRWISVLVGAVSGAHAAERDAGYRQLLSGQGMVATTTSNRHWQIFLRSGDYFVVVGLRRRAGRKNRRYQAAQPYCDHR